MQSLRSNRLVLALSFNGIVLLLILLAMVTRENKSLAQMQPGQASLPVSGMSVMPAQLSPNTWGCYLMDTQDHTLCVYQFSPGEHELKLAAGRDIQYDVKLGNYNTVPSPIEIHHLQERAEVPVRAAPATQHSPEAGQ